jgi:mannose-6-phosphate isomerase-like protein (cupin superfamily)
MTESGSAPDSFPGGTALTMLDVYDWIAPDGLRGGSAHVHLASTEGYVVLAGRGRLQTLGARGYAEADLRPGDCLWFTPGIIHRLVNEGGLRLLVIMANAGLPEAGDAVLTFPPEILADPAAYARAAVLPADGTPEASSLADGALADGALADGALADGALADGALADGALADGARRRRDLAIEGYLTLRDRAAGQGPAALEGFFAAAVRLVAARVPQWRDRWQAGALGAAVLTGSHLDQIADGDAAHLAAGVLRQIARPSGPRGYGMCGLLTRYDPGTAVARC